MARQIQIRKGKRKIPPPMPKNYGKIIYSPKKEDKKPPKSS